MGISRDTPHSHAQVGTESSAMGFLTSPPEPAPLLCPVSLLPFSVPSPSSPLPALPGLTVLSSSRTGGSFYFPIMSSPSNPLLVSKFQAASTSGAAIPNIHSRISHHTSANCNLIHRCTRDRHKARLKRSGEEGEAEMERATEREVECRFERGSSEAKGGTQGPFPGPWFPPFT